MIRVPQSSSFASVFIKNEKNPLYYFLRMFIIISIMTASMSFPVMFSEMGFIGMLLKAFVFSFPETFLYTYVVGVIIFPFLLKLTMSLCMQEG